MTFARVFRASRVVPRSFVRTQLSYTARSSNLLSRMTAMRSYSTETQSENNEPEKIELKDENMPKQFFGYDTGRFMNNDKVQREQRITKFSVTGLLETLKDEVDFLQKSEEQPDFGIAYLQPLAEGKHNKIYKITLKDGRCYALRIPYALGHREYREHRLLSEAATMDFLKKKHSAKVPSLISYSATSDNKLKSPYILMDFVSGENSMKLWKPWSLDVTEKEPIINAAVQHLSTHLKTKFSMYGSLYFSKDLPEKYANNTPYDGETDADLVGRWCIGPSTEKRFWRGKSVETGAELRGPWESWRSYLSATAQVQLKYLEEAMAASPNSPVLAEATKAGVHYKDIAADLFSDEEVTGEIGSPRLHNPDVNPLNIVVQDNDLEATWLLDFENTAIRPFVFHGFPWFVSNTGMAIGSIDEIPDYDKLSEQEKMMVDHARSRTLTQNTFELAYLKALPDLFYALHPSLRLRGEIVNKAMSIDITSAEYNDLNEALLFMQALWANIETKPKRDFPVDIDAEAQKEMAEALFARNKELMQNPLLETKGWLPTPEFEKLLGTGVIEPDEANEGSYKFSKAFLEQTK